MTQIGPGMLLLATPALQDPNFADTVILLLEANDDGALGVVLNRPSEVPVAAALGEWAEVVGEPAVLFQGGPVETEGALAVALLKQGVGGTVGFLEVSGALGMLDLDTPRELISDALDGLRIFAGYAGWGTDQLQSEIDEGHWYVVPGRPDDVLSSDSRRLWRNVMRRQPGSLALHSTRPADPRQN